MDSVVDHSEATHRAKVYRFLVRHLSFVTHDCATSPERGVRRRDRVGGFHSRSNPVERTAVEPHPSPPTATRVQPGPSLSPAPVTTPLLSASQSSQPQHRPQMPRPSILFFLQVTALPICSCSLSLTPVLECRSLHRAKTRERGREWHAEVVSWRGIGSPLEHSRMQEERHCCCQSRF